MLIEIIVSIISFVGVLFVLVLVHEWGHYIAARKNGVRVYEFGFGFPPRIAKLWHRHGTDFTVNWIPLGGFVKLKGEDGADAHDPDSFAHKTAVQRLVILFAGVFMNFVLGFLIYVGLFLYGVQMPISDVHPGARIEHERVVVGGVLQNSPAERAGVRAGDEIVSIDGVEIVRDAEVPAIVSQRSGQLLPVTVSREGALVSLSVVPEEIQSGVVGIGVRVVTVGEVSYGFGRAITAAASEVAYVSTMIFKTLGQLITTLVTSGQLQQGISGPVGIAVVTGKVAQSGLVPLFQLMAMLSINLGVLNALPFPALDGGRALFVVLEKVVRKKVRAHIEQFAHVTGFALLMLLILAVTYRDIIELIK